MKDVPRFNNINRILIQRLRKYNFQNFSQLLNSPEPEPSYFSYFESIANFLYDTVYDDQANLESEINKDLDKFSVDCITIEDSSQNIKHKKKSDEKEQINEIKNPKKNLSFLLNEPIDKYIQKIRETYDKFCKNHNEIKKIENKNKIINYLKSINFFLYYFYIFLLIY